VNGTENAHTISPTSRRANRRRGEFAEDGEQNPSRNPYACPS